MRVAYVSADRGVPIYGNKGPSVHVQEVVRALKTCGVSVEIFAARVGGTVPPGFEGVAVHKVSNERRAGPLDPPARERAAMQANRAFSRALRREGPFDVVYERYSLWSFAGMRYARQAGIPGVLEVNAPLIEEQAEHRALCQRASADRIAMMNFAAAHTIVAVSTGVADYIRRFPGTDERLAVVPNGVDPSRFPSREVRQRGAGNGFTVGFVGTLKPWHGLPTLVEAFAELHREDPTMRLLIVGDGPLGTWLEHSLDASGISQATRTTGAVSPQAIPALLSSIDAAVAPYTARPDFYFSPLKILEYMAAGLPIVASRIGQIQELISDGETGLLSVPDDSHSLADHLRRLRDDPALRLRLGAAARLEVERRHTWLDVTQRIFAHAGVGLHRRSEWGDWGPASAGGHRGVGAPG